MEGNFSWLILEGLRNTCCSLGFRKDVDTHRGLKHHSVHLSSLLLRTKTQLENFNCDIFTFQLTCLENAV